MSETVGLIGVIFGAASFIVSVIIILHWQEKLKDAEKEAQRQNTYAEKWEAMHRALDVKYDELMENLFDAQAKLRAKEGEKE